MLSYGPVATAVFGAIVIVFLFVPPLQLNHPGNTDLLTITFVAILSVAISLVRSRRDAHLVTVRTVAEAAQLAVLPPLPDAWARCAARRSTGRRSATLVGGDFFDVRAGPYGVRAVMGDVQGQRAIRPSRPSPPSSGRSGRPCSTGDLKSAAARLDRRLIVDLAQTAHAELFATALLLEFSADADAVRLTSCGHPHPFLLRDGKAVELVLEPEAPRSRVLRDLRRSLHRPAGARQQAVPRLRRSDREPGRDGRLYPLAERLTTLARESPADLTDRLWEDLLRFCTAVRDDVTMLVLTPDVQGERG